MSYIINYRILFYYILYLGIFTGQAYAESTINQKVNQSTQPAPIEKSILPKVDINKASAQDIADKVKGIGFKKAQAIIHYREKYGAFKHVEELLEVKGIGVSVFELNKNNIEFIVTSD